MNRARRFGTWIALSCVMMLTMSAAIGDHGPGGAGGAPGRVAVGSEAPGFRLETADGSFHSLSDLRGKKNLVLIFFRGTW